MPLITTARSMAMRAARLIALVRVIPVMVLSLLVAHTGAQSCAGSAIVRRERNRAQVAYSFTSARMIGAFDRIRYPEKVLLTTAYGYWGNRPACPEGATDRPE